MIEAEQLEVAIDAFLSTLQGKGILKGKRSEELPGFADTFKWLFSDDQEVWDAADNFEQSVTSYFGWIEEDNVSSAYQQLARLKREVARVRDRLENER